MRGLTQALQELVLQRTQGERVNTGTAGACPRENTGTAEGRGLTQALQALVLQRLNRVERACPAENTGWRGLTQALQELVLQRTQGGEG